jgi:hypothetical protein
VEIKVYNLFQDAHTIFPFEQASYKREWMDAYSSSFAYRCLPLKIANEAGWLVRCPIDFTAEYVSDLNPLESVQITIQENSPYKLYIKSHFGRGVVTFSLPYVLRTLEPWCVWVRGYPNYYKENVSFLEGIIETYWLDSTFTYNIRLVEKNKPVSFKKGEPLFFLTCIDLQSINKSVISYSDIGSDLDTKTAYEQWSSSRRAFNESPKDPEDWQKDYFKGLKSNNIVESHLTTIKTYIKDEQ